VKRSPKLGQPELEFLGFWLKLAAAPKKLLGDSMLHTSAHRKKF